MATLQESYDGAEATGWGSLNVDIDGLGQSFEAPNTIEIYSVKFFMNREGGATGDATVKLWSHSGTFGTSSVPNTLLATGDAFDVTAVANNGFTLTGMQFYEILFTGAERYQMQSGTRYVVTIEFAGNNLVIGGDFATPSHAGNGVELAGSWAAGGYDIPFEVWGEAIAVGGTRPSSLGLLGVG